MSVLKTIPASNPSYSKSLEAKNSNKTLDKDKLVSLTDLNNNTDNHLNHKTANAAASVAVSTTASTAVSTTSSSIEDDSSKAAESEQKIKELKILQAKYEQETDAKIKAKLNEEIKTLKGSLLQAASVNSANTTVTALPNMQPTTSTTESPAISPTVSSAISSNKPLLKAYFISVLSYYASNYSSYLNTDLAEQTDLILDAETNARNDDIPVIAKPKRMHSAPPAPPSLAAEIDAVDDRKIIASIFKLTENHQTNVTEKHNGSLVKMAEMQNDLNKVLTEIEALGGPESGDANAKTKIDKTKVQKLMREFLKKWTVDIKNIESYGTEDLEKKSLAFFNSKEEAEDAFQNGFKDILEIVKRGDKFYICFNREKWINKMKDTPVYQGMSASVDEGGLGIQFEVHDKAEEVTPLELSKGDIDKLNNKKIVELIFGKVEEIVKKSSLAKTGNNSHTYNESRMQNALNTAKTKLLNKRRLKSFTITELENELRYGIQLAIKAGTYDLSGNGNDHNLDVVNQFINSHFSQITSLIINTDNNFFTQLDSTKRGLSLMIKLDANQLSVYQNNHTNLKEMLKPIQNQITSKITAATDKEKQFSQLLSDLLRAIIALINKL